MSSLYQLQYAGTGQELLSLMFSVSRVEQVRIQSSKLAASCIVSSDPLCLIQYSMVHLTWVKLVVKVLVSGSFLLSSMDVGSSGVG